MVNAYTIASSRCHVLIYTPYAHCNLEPETMDSFNMSTIPYTSGDFKLEPCAQCYRAKLHAVTVTWAYTYLSFGTKLKSLFFFLKAMNLPKSEGQKDYFCKACCSCNNNYSSEIINIILLSCMHRPIQPKSLN